MSEIALTAPTGKVGTAFIAAAEAARVSVRPIRQSTADRVAALAGSDVVFLIGPSVPHQVAWELGVIDDAIAAGVGHVIKLSYAGVVHPEDRFSQAHVAIERELAKRSIAWTVLRPTFFMENLLALDGALATGVYPAAMADQAIGQVATADIAASALAVARDPRSHAGAVYTLTASRAYRGDEIATALAAARGHEIRYVALGEDDLRGALLGAGADPWYADGVVELYRPVRAGLAAHVSGDVAMLTGRPPIDLETWAARSR